DHPRQPPPALLSSVSPRNSYPQFPAFCLSLPTWLFLGIYPYSAACSVQAAPRSMCLISDFGLAAFPSTPSPDSDAISYASLLMETTPCSLFSLMPVGRLECCVMNKPQACQDAAV
ncbi:hypothetical protein LEMLEM_LOCUS26403, partial [Lemmus lemmus]